MPPRSKRQRKARAANSLRAKKARAGGNGFTAADYESGGEDEAVGVSGGGGEADTVAAAAVVDGSARPCGDDANAAIILPSKKKKGGAGGGAEPATPALPPQPKLSKAAARKARRVAEEKAARAARASALATLAAAALPPAARGLLHSTASLGQRETKAQRVKRALVAERLGLGVDGSDLLRARPEVEGAPPPLSRGAHARAGRPPSPPSGASDDDDDDDDDVDDANTAPAAAAPPPLTAEEARAAAAAARAELGLPAPGEGMGESEGEDEGGRPRPPPLPPLPGPARVVAFDTRPADLAACRADLPIAGMEQEVMEAVAASDVLLLCGETGSGKTTQVPQFLLEAGYGSDAHPDTGGGVLVTQPRRVAAAAAAARVAAELGVRLGGLVGYQVRHDARVASGGATRCKFVTDGLLLRELASDFLLSSHSAIIVDEAHERSLNTDLLLGLLSRVVTLRRRLSAAGAALPPTTKPALAARLGGRVRPLKLIIMSATLRLDDFAANPRLFPSPPPVVHVPARQFPVTIHFAQRTAGEREYAKASAAKAAQIHTTLPPGGILVFLTGRREVDWVVAKLRREHGPKAVEAEAASEAPDPADLGGGGGGGGGDAAEDAAADAASEAALRSSEATDDYDAAEALSDEEETWQLGGSGFTPEQVAAAEAAFAERTGVDLAALGGGGAAATAAAAQPRAPRLAMHVLPLYAALPRPAQDRVFAPPPPGTRLVVVATNVAETSLTIPGVRYVVDAGRAKSRSISRAGDRGAAIARYEVGWVSQASADQRAGRAGRTGPGHCYRLYSAAAYGESLPPHAPAEIEGAPLEGVALALRALGVDKVAHFPFPTPPDRAALVRADEALRALGALAATGSDGGHALTPLGRAMATLPISPRHARALLEVGRAVAAGEARPRALAAAVGLAAALSVESPFLADAGGGGGGGDEGEDGGGADTDAAAARKARRASVKEAQARLRDESGDALSALVALTAFEAAVAGGGGGGSSTSPAALSAGDAFCRAHGLVARHLREAAALRLQLAGIVARAAGEAGAAPGHPLAGLPPAAAAALVDAGGPPPHPPRPLSTTTRTALLRGLVAGWADQVGRRVRSDAAIKAAAAAAGRSRAVRYEPCSAPDLGGGGGGGGGGPADVVFLHPHSALGARAPEWVVYADLVASAKRVYMVGVSAIDAGWLAACAPGLTAVEAPGADAPARWERRADAALVAAPATYGPRGWALPAVPVRHPDAGARALAFAEAVLDGRAVAGLGQALGPWLVEPPASLRRPGALGVRRVGDLVRRLRTARVDSLASLAAAWKADPTFLQRELGAWVRQPGGPGALAGAWAGALADVRARRV